MASSRRKKKMNKPEADRSEVVALYFSCCISPEWGKTYHQQKAKLGAIKRVRMAREKRQRIAKAKQASMRSLKAHSADSVMK
jgi:hypothetical protein